MGGRVMTQAPLRVLVVEDELLIAMMAEDMLTALGCETVGPAARVEQGLALAAFAEIDAALLDVNLAGSTSFPIADALRLRGVPFAFTTAYGRSALRECDQDVPVIEKPYGLREIAK